MIMLHWSELVRGDDAFHVAYVDASSSSGWVRHQHDFHEVFRVESGIGRHWSGKTGEETLLETGDVFFIRPTDAHGFRAEVSSEPFAIVNVAFAGSSWRELADRYGWGGAGLYDMGIRTPEAHRADATGDRMAASFFREMLHARKSRAALDWFLLSLARVFDEGIDRETVGGAPAWLRRALATFARDETGYARGPEALARLAGCTPSHLSRSFRQHMGKTAIDWIQDLRLKRAGRLLESTGYSITDVAAMSGFENLSNFHRRFRERYAETPLAYRKRNRRKIA